VRPDHGWRRWLEAWDTVVRAGTGIVHPKVTAEWGTGDIPPDRTEPTQTALQDTDARAMVRRDAAGDLVGRGRIELPQSKTRVLQTLGLTTCPTDPRGALSLLTLGSAASGG